MIDLLAYIEDDFLNAGCEDIYRSVADYFDFENRCIPIEQHEIDFIKILFTKKCRRNYSGECFEMNVSEMPNDELLKQYEHYKDIVKIPHSVKDVVRLYEIEDELERREKSVDEFEFEEDRLNEERIEVCDDE